VSDDILGIAVYKGQLQKPVRFGSIFKWIRWRVGRQVNPKRKQPKQQPFIQSRQQHHRLNIWLACGASIMLYSVLSQIVGEELAFLATLLWTVHPLGVQCVGWISGVPYVLSALLAFAGLGFALNTAALPPQYIILYYIIFALLQALAVNAQFAVGGITIILWLVGQIQRSNQR